MSDYRIEIKVRNNTLLGKLEKAGYKSIGEFCRLNNVRRYASRIGDVVAMKCSPLTFNGDFIPAIIFLSEKIGCSPEDLFTNAQINTILKTNKKAILVNEAEVKFMLEQQNNHKLLEEVIFSEQLTSTLDKVLDTLSPTEKRILQMRNGLGEYNAHTLVECAKIEDVSPERIRQIEARALRKLRHPGRHKALNPYLSEEI